MSTLLYTSPRSSPSPAHHHPSMARQQVAFGQSNPAAYGVNNAAQQPASSSVGGGGGASTAFPSISDVSNPQVPLSAASSSSSSFGFGFGSGAGTSSSSTSSGHVAYGSGVTRGGGSASIPSSSTSYTPFKLPQYTSSMSVGATSSMTNAGPSISSNRRRRRRSDSQGDRDMEDQTSSSQQHQDDHDGVADDSMYLSGGKRLRREIRPVKSMAALSSSNSQHQSSVSNASSNNSNNGNTSGAGVGNEVDVGKVLASLSKPALLTVLTSLLATQPALKPAVLALLPPPSLESFTSTLQAAERKVLDALPVGRNLRDEYVWSRFRAPLEEYISEARVALGQFCPTFSSASTSLQSDAGDSQTHQQQQQHHPATTFSFLYNLTQSVRKLEAILPRAPLPFGQSNRLGGGGGGSHSSGTNNAPASINNPSSLNQNDPLVCFLPALFNQWHVLVTKLSSLVNQNGRVLSAEMVRTWFKQLDSLVELSILGNLTLYNVTASSSSHLLEQDASSVGKKASEAVRERFIKELGWLIGMRQATPGTGIQAVANQLMDSRMMMEDSDDEL